MITDFSPPDARRVMVLAPHPDDESLGCAGAILLYAERGVNVHLVVISNGEKAETGGENLGEARKSECLSAADILGIRNTLFLEFPDAELETHKGEIKERLSALVRDIAPDIIFAPSPLDPHPDHRVVSGIALTLLPEFPGMKAALYEIYHPFRPNVLVDITPVMEKKKSAIMRYEKSLLGVPEVFLHSIEALNAFRSLVYRRKGFYEAFWLIDRPISQNDLLDWATFGHRIMSPAEVFLQKLKITDALVHELQNAHGSIEGKNAEIAALREALGNAERMLNELNERKTEAPVGSLILSPDSMSGKILTTFYRARDAMLPEGTRRKKLYRRAVEKLKGR